MWRQRLIGFAVHAVFAIPVVRSHWWDGDCIRFVGQVRRILLQ
jgi:hypothetical protein